MPTLRRRVLATGALVLTTAVGAACGHSTQNPAAANPAVVAGQPAAAGSAATNPATNRGTTNACSVVTEQDAAVALGGDPGPGEEVTSLGASSCAYGMSPALVTVNLLPSGGKSAYDHARGLAAPGQLLEVTGVGEAAFGVSKGPLASIEFYKGDALVTIVVMVGGASSAPQDHALALAKTAAGRM